MSTRQVTTAQTRDRARTAVRSRLRGWLTDPAAAQHDALTVALHPPTERAVADDPDGARDWVRHWQRYDGPGTVEWESRRWPSFGTQNVPVRLRLTGVAEIFRAAGDAARWRNLRQRRDTLVALSDTEDYPAAVAVAAPKWEVLSDDDFARLVATTRWLLANPDSGLLIRQLPIEGVDTKWLGLHIALVRRLIVGARQSPELGFRPLPSLHELAILDPALLPGMPPRFATPLDSLAALPVTPSTVLILENREGLHALPPLRGTIALHGSGNAVTALTGIGWLRDTDIVYWGDLDTHGLIILNRLRSRLPHVRSFLMDPETLETWQHLAVPEPVPTDEEPTHLSDSELDTLRRLQATALRLEQERLPWPYVLEHLATAGFQRLDVSSESDSITH